MRIFLSWSGQRSKRVAEILRTWLPAVVQAARPYFSPDDIQKGARWNTEVAKELEASQVGVLCVTRENISAPWLLFEAGALAKSLDRSRVIPLLVDLEPADLSGPLSQFQAAKFDSLDVKRLVTVINEQLGTSALEAAVLTSVFDKWWPDLEQKVHESLHAESSAGVGPTRTDRQLLEEVLALVRDYSFRANPQKGIIARAMAAQGFEPFASLALPVEALELTERTLFNLQSGGLRTVGDVVKMSEHDLLRQLPNMGRKSLNELIEVLASRGHQLAPVPSKRPE